MVGTRALHAVAVLDAPPEIPAAHDDTDLNAQIDALFNRVAHPSDAFVIQPEVLFPRKRLSAYLDKHALVFCAAQDNQPLYLLFYIISAVLHS